MFATNVSQIHDADREPVEVKIKQEAANGGGLTFRRRDSGRFAFF
jgi:hypothetical protein